FSILIPDSVTSIDKFAFMGCPLTSIVLSKNLHSLPDCVFYGNHLVSYTVPDNIQSLGTKVFGQLSDDVFDTPQNVNISALTSIELSDNVTSIGDEAFSGLDKLVHIKLSSKLTELPDAAFANNYSLKSVVIPMSVTKIGYKCFTGCPLDGEKVFKIPKNVEVIEIGAFGNCKALKEIILPPKLMYVDEKLAFEGCDNLKKIVYPKNYGNNIAFDDIYNDD
ncbi:hypothetical protein EIN_239930, partial [Entamoeba invadens IP1]